MAKINLTAKALAALKPQPKRADYFDRALPGFCVRVTPAGRKTFAVLYRDAGRLRRYTIGAYPPLTLADARDWAREVLRAAAKGEDPQDRKRQRREAPTFAEVAAQYLERYASKKKSGRRDAEYLRRDVLPHWGGRKAADITRRDVIELIEGKAEQAPIAANRLLACVRKLFNWAMSRDLLEANPCVQVKAPGQENKRDRVLSDQEILTCWRVLETGLLDKGDGLEPAALAIGVRSILRFILITAQRPGEVCEIEWADIEGEWWTVPAGKAKNGLSHRVSLTKLAKEILDAQPRESRWVFASPRHDRPIQVNALAHALRREDHFGLEHFAPHDLRRTAATAMGSLGVNRFVLGRVLNHVETGVTAVYDRASYDGEKRGALAKWEAKLRGILVGEPSGKVVAIG